MMTLMELGDAWDKNRQIIAQHMRDAVRRAIDERDLRSKFAFRVNIRGTMIDDVATWCGHGLTGRYTVAYGSVWTSSKEHVVLLRLAFGAGVWLASEEKAREWIDGLLG